VALDILCEPVPTVVCCQQIIVGGSFTAFVLLVDVLFGPVSAGLEPVVLQESGLLHLCFEGADANVKGSLGRRICVVAAHDTVVQMLMMIHVHADNDADRKT
jgi:hypothetical protein